MRVITKNPILVNSEEVEPKDMYLNADAATARALARGGKPVDNKKQLRNGQVWDKTKGAWVKAQDSGLLSSLGNMFGVNQPTSSYPESSYPSDYDPNAKQPMSPGLKTGLIIGGVVLASVAVYFLVKSNKSGK